MTEPDEHPGPPRLDNLAAFLPAFADPEFSVGSPGGPTYFDYSEAVNRFVDVAYEDGWVSPEVDWPSWKETEEARRLRDVPTAIPEATAEQLQKLLTTVIRQDRFVTGALAGAFESGLLTAIVRRAEQLRLAAVAEGSES